MISFFQAAEASKVYDFEQTLRDIRKDDGPLNWGLFEVGSCNFILSVWSLRFEIASFAACRVAVQHLDFA